MVKARLEKKLRQDPAGVMIIILVILVLSVGTLVYLHAVQAHQISELKSDITELSSYIER